MSEIFYCCDKGVNKIKIKLSYSIFIFINLYCYFRE